MKMVKKLIAFALCATLLCTSMVFTSFAAEDVAAITAKYKEHVITEHNFEDSELDASYSEHISGSDSNRKIVEGINPNNENGKQIQITYTGVNNKQNFVNMFNNDRVGVDGTYKISFYAKVAESSSVAEPYVYLDIFDGINGNNGYIRVGRKEGDPAIKLNKAKWTPITYEYSYNEVDNIKDDYFSLRVMDASLLTSSTKPPFTAEECDYTVSSDNPIVVLIDDVQVIETKETSYNEPDYTYNEIALLNFNNTGTNYFSGGTKSHTTDYNYSGDTAGALKLTTGAKSVYKVKSNASGATGICDVEDLEDNTRYRYSFMVKLDDTYELTESTINIILYPTTASANGDYATYNGKKDGTPIYKDAWTKVHIDINTSAEKCTSIGLQTTDAINIVLDDFKIEKMTEIIPIETSFTFDDNAVENITEAGEYTASVKFGSNFDGEKAAVIFAKYVDGILDEVVPVANADLTNGASNKFNISAQELDTCTLSIFVWDSIDNLIPLVAPLTISKSK